MHKKPEPVQPKLDPALSRKELGYIVSSFFDPGLWLEKALNLDDFKWMIDKFAADGLTNYIRWFAWICYEESTNRIVLHPHPRKTNGKWDIFKINQGWLDRLCLCLDYQLNAGIEAEIDVFNGGRHWDRFWMNPANTDDPMWGYRDPEFHSYEYIGNPDIGRAHDYFMFFFPYVADYLWSKFGHTNLLNFGINEARARDVWHKQWVWDKILAPLGVPNENFITSFDINDSYHPWNFAEYPQYFVEKNVGIRISIHGCRSWGRIIRLKEESILLVNPNHQPIDYDMNPVIDPDKYIYFKIIPDGEPVMLSEDGCVFGYDENDNQLDLDECRRGLVDKAVWCKSRRMLGHEMNHGTWKLAGPDKIRRMDFKSMRVHMNAFK